MYKNRPETYVYRSESDESIVIIVCDDSKQMEKMFYRQAWISQFF